MISFCFESGQEPLKLQAEGVNYKGAQGGISLVVQWLRLWAPNAGDLDLTLGQGTRSHMWQLRVCLQQPTCHNKGTRATIKDPVCRN